jgi:hypothetical protein
LRVPFLAGERLEFVSGFARFVTSITRRAETLKCFVNPCQIRRNKSQALKCRRASPCCQVPSKCSRRRRSTSTSERWRIGLAS